MIRAELRPDDSLGARVAEARRRRDHLIAVIGEREAAADAVQVTDVAGGHRETVPVKMLVDKAVEARDGRLHLVRWP